MKIRVVVADDHPIVREGLRYLLESQPDIDVVGEAGDGQSALEATHQLRPDVVLMDLAMPGLSGLEAIRTMTAEAQETRVVALTGSESDELFFQTLEAGASGYVLKGGEASDMITAVRAAAQGEVFLHPSMSRKLLGDYLQLRRGERERDPYDALTDREREVLQLIAGGHTNREVASMLTLSPNTVQTHRMHIMEKLGLSSRADLIAYAVGKGLLNPEK